jgi:hypothetical protein
LKWRQWTVLKPSLRSVCLGSQWVGTGLMLPKRHAFFRSLVNSSLDSEIGATSHCFLTRPSLFEGNPLRVPADAAPCAYKWVWYIPLCSARDCVPWKWKRRVFARSRFRVESITIECLGQARDYGRKAGVSARRRLFTYLVQSMLELRKAWLYRCLKPLKRFNGHDQLKITAISRIGFEPINLRYQHLKIKQVNYLTLLSE